MMAVQQGYDPTLKGIACYLHSQTSASMKDIFNNLVVMPRRKAAHRMSEAVIGSDKNNYNTNDINDDNQSNNIKIGNISPQKDNNFSQFNKFGTFNNLLNIKHNHDKNVDASSNSNSNSSDSDNDSLQKFKRFTVSSIMNNNSNGFGGHGACYLSWKLDDIDGLAIQAKSGDNVTKFGGIINNSMDLSRYQ